MEGDIRVIDQLMISENAERMKGQSLNIMRTIHESKIMVYSVAVDDDCCCHSAVAMRTPLFVFLHREVGVLFAESGSEIEGVITTAKTDQLYQSLRRAKNLNGDIHYQIKDQYGIGIKYISTTHLVTPLVVVDSGDEIHFIVTDLHEAIISTSPVSPLVVTLL